MDCVLLPGFGGGSRVERVNSYHDSLFSCLESIRSNYQSADGMTYDSKKFECFAHWNWMHNTNRAPNEDKRTCKFARRFPPQDYYLDHTFSNDIIYQARNTVQCSDCKCPLELCPLFTHISDHGQSCEYLIIHNLVQNPSSTDSVGQQNLVWEERTKWAVGELYSLVDAGLNASAGGVYIDMSRMVFEADPTPPGFYFDPQTGQMLGIPKYPCGRRRSSNYNETTDIVVIVDGKPAAIAGSIHFEYLEADFNNPHFGPNGRNCSSGTIVDKIEFDGQFSCNCTDRRYVGENCDSIPSLNITFMAD